MGETIKYRCKKCGYSFIANLGVGFLYPKTYAETVIKMKEGKFGAQGKEFFEVFPEGAISCEEIIVQCNDCGELMNVLDLSLYIPKEGYSVKKGEKDRTWSTGFSGVGDEYVSPFELDEKYQLFERYDHRCTKCNGHTSQVIDIIGGAKGKNLDNSIKCPKCESDLEIESFWRWD